ncbi:DUF5667 domain-containing protein [Actinosynnema sp. NPDC059797]
MWRHRQREQFARAVDAHPEPGDEAFADELAVVALLREAAVTSGPDEAAKARMRERVLGAATPPTKLDSRRPRSGARGRLAVALAAALCLVFSLAGMSLLLSRDALPGDALYGVKRTAESASLGLTFGEDSKGYKLLEFASARLTEVETLADRYSGDGPLGGYLTALADFDTDAAAGSRVLTAFGSGSDRRALEDLRDWAGSQAERLTRLRPVLPQDAVTRADASLDLLAHIGERATALQSRPTCGGTDDLGPLPAEDECAPRQPAPTTSPTAPPTASPTAPDVDTPGAPTTTANAPNTPAPTTTVDAPPTSQPVPPTTTTPGGPVLPLPTLPLPSLPLPGLGG